MSRQLMASVRSFEERRGESAEKCFDIAGGTIRRKAWIGLEAIPASEACMQ